MKKLLAVVACLCLLVCAAASAEEISENGFLLKIRNESGLDISYLRFDAYIGDQHVSMVCSCPDEGEDFYRFPYEADDPAELESLRIECSYGRSDLSPEEAILEVMKGTAAKEFPLLTLDFTPEGGKTYDLKLVSDGSEGWLLVPFEAE